MVAMGVSPPVDPALAKSLDKPFPWDVGFCFGNTKLSMELWTTIAGISGSTIEVADALP